MINNNGAAKNISKTLKRSTSFYNYEDYISYKKHPGSASRNSSKLHANDSNKYNNPPELTRHRLKEQYEEMKLNTLKINKSRQIMLHQTDVKRNNKKKHRYYQQHFGKTSKHEDAQALLEEMHKFVNKNYFSVDTWYSNLKKVKDLFNHNFNPNWVENIFSQLCNVNSKRYDIDVFLLLLSLENTPPKHITIQIFLDRLYDRLKKFSLEAVDTKYFLKDMESAVSRAHQTIQKSQKKLRKKIENHFYEDEFVRNMRHQHSSVKIPNDKIINAIIGDKKNSSSKSYFYDKKQNDTTVNHLKQGEKKIKKNTRKQQSTFFSRSKVFNFDTRKRFQNKNSVRGIIKSVNSNQFPATKLLGLALNEHSSQNEVQQEEYQRSDSKQVHTHPPIEKNNRRQEYQLSTRTKKIANNYNTNATVKTILTDKNLTLDQYQFPKKYKNRTNVHNNQISDSKGLIKVCIPKSRQSQSRSTLSTRSDSRHNSASGLHHHALTPDTAPPTAFQDTYHHLNENEIHAKKNAIEIYEWRRLENQISKRQINRSNELSKGKEIIKEYSTTLGELRVAETVVSLKAKHHSNRPMSVRHRLLEASKQLNTLPCHFGIKSHDVSHQIESASDHSHKGLNDENIIVICHGIRNVKTLDTINFSHNRISGKGCQKISKLIQHNSNILHLDLSGNVKIQSNGVAYLTKGFQHLLELNLSKCRVNNEAAVLLCDGLITNKSIETLILAHNDISDRGAKDLGKMLPRHPNLRDLILKWNMIGNEGAAAIGYGLRDTRCKLENLDLSFNGFGGGVGNKNAALEFSQALFTNKHLHHLNLAHNRLTRHDIYIILRRIDRDNDTLLCVHLEGNWMHGTFKTHEGLANNKSDVMNSLESHEEEKIECPAFQNALNWRINSQNEDDENLDLDTYGKQGNENVKIHDLNIRTHLHATHEANEPHLYDDGIETNNHSFLPVNEPGSSFLFTRVLGRPHMSHEMNWKEVAKCWVCCEASEYLFHAKSLSELGISQLGKGGNINKWWESVEVHYFDSSGMPRVGRNTPSNNEQVGFYHYGMVCPGKVHFFFRDGNIPYDQKDAKARGDRIIYTHEQHERRIDAAKMLQRRWRMIRKLQPYVKEVDLGAFHISTQQQTESTTRKEFLYSGINFANYDYVKPRDKPLMPDTTFIRRRKDKKAKKWNLKSSCFRSVYLDSDPLMRKCVKVDWNAVNYSRMFKSAEEIEGIYNLIIHHYKHICGVFKFYSADTYDLALSEELFNVNKIMFLKLLQDIEIINDKLSNKSRGDYERIYISSLLSKTNVKLMGLYRPQFTSALLRVACLKYHDDIECNGSKTKMCKKFFEGDFEKCKVLDYDAFRQKFMFNREVDNEVSAYIPILRKLFGKHAQINIETHEKSVLFLPGFMEAIEIFRVNDFVDKREMYRTFIRSQITPATQFDQPLKMYLRFNEFTDTLCWFAFLSTIPHKDRDEIDNYDYLRVHMNVLPNQWFVEALHDTLKYAEVNHKKNSIQFTYLSKIKAKLHKIRKRAQNMVHEKRELMLIEAHECGKLNLK